MVTLDVSITKLAVKNAGNTYSPNTEIHLNFAFRTFSNDRNAFWQLPNCQNAFWKNTKTKSIGCSKTTEYVLN